MEHVTTFLTAFAHITGWAVWLLLLLVGSHQFLGRFDYSYYGRDSNIRAALGALLVIALAALAFTLVPILYPHA